MDLDLFIFSAFLALSLVLGFMSSTKVTNISEYAIGNRDFSTATLVATMVATWVGAGFFSNTLTETYRQGVYYLIPASVNSLVLILIGYIFGPRMGEFLGKLTISQSMGEIFGPRVKGITIIFSLLRSICYLGIQFKVSSTILELIFGTSGEYATIFSAIIVLIYSALGGIRAVTFTDVIQFFTFGCLMPIIAIIAWQALGHSSSIKVWNTLTTNPIFDLKEAFSLNNPKFYEMMGVCLFFSIPKFGPETFQRIAMARSVSQIIRSYSIAGLLCFLIQAVMTLIAILILSHNPRLDPNNLIGYIIDHYSFVTGFRGIISVGIMAMIMSTADSVINSMSVIIAHDVCKPLGFKWSQNELWVARITAIFSSIAAVIFAIKVDSIFKLVLSFTGLYLPVVSIPFMITALGFRSSEKSMLVSMIGTVLIMLTVRAFFAKSIIDSFVLGVISSVTLLFGTHYFTKQSGGWIGIKDMKTYKAISRLRSRVWCKIWFNIWNFSFLNFCKNNAPQKIETFFFLGLLGIVSSIGTMVSVPSNLLEENNIAQYFYITVLTLSCYLVTYPLWPATFKNPKFVSAFWIMSIFINICINSIFLAMSAGSQIQTTIFFLNITAILLVFKWRTALFMLLISFVSSIVFITQYLHLEYLNLIGIKFYLIFCLLLVSSILLAFLRPVQETSEQTAELLAEKEKEVKNISQQLLNHMIIRQEFINNVNHEIRTPIHHVGAYLDELEYNLNSPDIKEKQESFKMLKQGYQRIRGYMDDILDLSNLSNNKVELKYKKVDLQKLVSDTLDQFIKLYMQDKDLHFNLDCRAKDVLVNCDKDKITQVLINLLKNAAEFTTKGTIEIILSNKNLSINPQQLKGIECSIIDEGVGIPEHELLEIFGPFIQSSRTKNMSGGKGLGLAICEHIIKLHHGRIYAKNNDKKGATVSFVIPIKKP